MKIVCPKCQALPGQSCRRPSGKACETHIARIQAEQALVPVVTAPVRALKEKFTLQGEPLPISRCMKALGLEIEKHEHAILAHFPVMKDQFFTIVYNLKPAESVWELAKYPADAEDFTAVAATEADVLMVLMRRYYRMHIRHDRRAPGTDIVKSLGARLVACSTPDQLDTFRSSLRAMRPTQTSSPSA